MGRAPCCDKQGMKKGPWAPEEDKLLIDYIQTNGHGSWRSLPKLAGLRRCGKSCRLRWTNYLRPDIKRGPFTDEEQKSIIQLHGIVGNKWSTIAAQLPGRTDNEIKNFWNTHLKKRLLHMGIDPNTLSSSCATSSIATSASATRHMAQWETARLEAEARLSREYLLFSTTSAAGTTTDTTNADKSICTASQVDDYILKLWNSEVGDAFRKKRDESGVPIIKTEPEITDETDSTKVMTGVDDSSGSNVVEDVYDEAAFQIYLEFAGDELSMFHNQRSEFASLFSSDLSEASLDSAFK